MSQLHDRLASLAVAVTVTFMFTCLTWLVPEIGHLSLPQAVGAYALNALVTVAIYKTIASSSCGRSRRTFCCGGFSLENLFWRALGLGITRTMARNGSRLRLSIKVKASRESTVVNSHLTVKLRQPAHRMLCQ